MPNQTGPLVTRDGLHAAQPPASPGNHESLARHHAHTSPNGSQVPDLIWCLGPEPQLCRACCRPASILRTIITVYLVAPRDCHWELIEVRRFSSAARQQVFAPQEPAVFDIAPSLLPAWLSKGSADDLLPGRRARSVLGPVRSQCCTAVPKQHDTASKARHMTTSVLVLFGFFSAKSASPLNGARHGVRAGHTASGVCATREALFP